MAEIRTGLRQTAPTSEPLADISLPWLTVERALYGLILFAGLGVRIAALGHWPLLETGANTALAAWRAVHGSAWRPAYYVPLLYDADAVLFWMIRATDATARLLPVLVGSALIVLPYFARDLLGRKGALVASLLLAFSPSWVYFSRTADSSILTAGAGALLLVAASGYARGKGSQHLRVGAIALGLGLTGGPGIYTLLVSALILALIWWWRWGRGKVAEKVRALFAKMVERKDFLVFLGVFLFFASGFLANLGGIGASVELAGHWVRSLAPSSTSLAWWAYPRTLIGYEFLTVALAVFGAIRGLWRRNRLDTCLVIWVGVVLILGTALGHREPGWILDALLPLVILAGRGFEGLWDHLARGASPADGIVGLAALPVIAFGFLEVASYTHTGQEQFLLFGGIAWFGAMIAWIAYLFWTQRDAALRVGVAWLMLIMAVMTIRATTAIAYQTGRDPRERLVYRPTSVQVRDMEASMSTLSSHLVGDSRLLDIEYERGLGPWLDWYLRDYPNAREVAYVGSRPTATALMTASRPAGEWPAGYAGQRFRLWETWPAQKWSAPDHLRWLMYRDPVGAVQTTDVYLWVRPPTGR